MEEVKAAAYYDDLVRKGGGAARFKQGLGYSEADSVSGENPKTVVHSSFVRGHMHNDSLAAIEKDARLATVREKLIKHPDNSSKVLTSRTKKRSSVRSRSHSHSSSCSHSSEERRNGHRKHQRSSRSSSPFDGRRKDRHGKKSHTSSSSYLDHSYSSVEERIRRRGSPYQPRRRSHHRSPSSHASEHCKHSDRSSSRRHKSQSPVFESRERIISRTNEAIRPFSRDKASDKKHTPRDYSKLIPGYDGMTPAEKVKAKMKLQLSEAALKNSGNDADENWERFDFDKNAPLDDDAKLDYSGGAHDDSEFFGKTGCVLFSSSHQQARRDAQLQEAHDAAMFGPPGQHAVTVLSPGEVKCGSSSRDEVDKDCSHETRHKTIPGNTLLSDQVLALQQESWRERALRLKEQRGAFTGKLE